MPSKRVIDWAAVERDYRTGQMTDRELGMKYGCSHAAIGKKARQLAWEKDLSADVRQATRAKLVNEAKSAAEAERKKRIEAGEQVEPVPDAVEVAAEVNKRVILKQQSRLDDMLKLAETACGRLQEKFTLTDADLELAAEMHAGDEAEPAARIRSRMQVEKMMGLPQTIQDLQRLSETVVRLQTAQRTAFGLDEPDAGKGDGEGVRAMTDAERATRLAALLAKARAAKDAAGA